jgi:hypothetical protein
LAPDSTRREELALRAVRDAIRGIKHGTVTLLVQDGIVIQLDRTEKTRMDYTRTGTLADGDGI